VGFLIEVPTLFSSIEKLAKKICKCLITERHSPKEIRRARPIFFSKRATCRFFTHLSGPFKIHSSLFYGRTEVSPPQYNCILVICPSSEVSNLNAYGRIKRRKDVTFSKLLLFIIILFIFLLLRMELHSQWHGGQRLSNEISLVMAYRDLTYWAADLSRTCNLLKI